MCFTTVSHAGFESLSQDIYILTLFDALSNFLGKKISFNRYLLFLVYLRLAKARTVGLNRVSQGGFVFLSQNVYILTILDYFFHFLGKKISFNRYLLFISEDRCAREGCRAWCSPYQ